ncbi:MAG: ImmA/IrrE family metallo-endopeptidase [Helcococcus sp.]|nr:ImmA/IrrE family metallo-endopeptidase [Helcococcus sp.]
MRKHYRATPISRKEIREVANVIRRWYKLENTLDFPIVEVFESLACFELFNYEIVPKEIMGNKYGETFPSEKHINIREDIYDKACEGDPFGKSTIAHELYHLLFHKENTISLCRTGGDIQNRKVYEDPEWQANCFAGELMVPKDLIAGMIKDEVIENCNVSESMADYQIKVYRREDNNSKY